MWKYLEMERDAITMEPFKTFAFKIRENFFPDNMVSKRFVLVISHTLVHANNERYWSVAKQLIDDHSLPLSSVCSNARKYEVNNTRV